MLHEAPYSCFTPLFLYLPYARLPGAHNRYSNNKKNPILPNATPTLSTPSRARLFYCLFARQSHFINEMSRLQPSSSSESPKSASFGPSDQRGELSEQPSSSTHPRVSEGSEGYPSWLPKRPPPPDPGSTVHSSNGVHTPGLTPVEPFNVGRKPTPRSVRVVSLQDATQPGRDHREFTEQTRFSNPLRPQVWSRATTAGMSSTLMSAAAHAHDRALRPKFRSNGLHPELLRNPTLLAKLYFYLFPFFTFYHIPLQTFFDFNAVFILLQCVSFFVLVCFFPAHHVS